MPSNKTKGNPLGYSRSAGDRQTLKIVYLLPLCFLLFGGCLAGCSNSFPVGMGWLNASNASGSVTKISDIPQLQKTTATVYLQGRVANRAPFMRDGAYQLQDDTGTIWVFANQPLPTIGDILAIEGQLQFQSIPLGGQDFGEVFVIEQRVIERRAGRPEQPILPEGSYE